MTDSDTTPIDENAAGSVDYRQVAFVVLATLALILTAFVAPPITDSESGPSNGGGDGLSSSGDSPDVSFNWRDLLNWLDFSGENDSTRREQSSHIEQCSVTLIGSRVPGNRVNVAVRCEGQPISDVTVWFNDRRIGQTNGRGLVSGKVPYTEELQVHVSIPCEEESVDCEFVKESFAGTGIATLEFRDDTGETRSNSTLEFDVKGTVDLAIEGKPYPGETVVIEASIEGVPMRRATVEIDGEPVGQTDDDGRVTVRVPDDGSEQFEVRVSRGDFSGTATVDVLLLDVSLHSEGLVVVPGTTATVETRLGNQTVEGAVVTVNGERRGTTGPNGTLDIMLPLDPTATVTVSTGEQTASTSVAAMYEVVVLLLTLVVGILTMAVYRTRGLRSALIVLAAVCASLVAMIADPVWGILVVGIIAVVAVLVRWQSADRKITTNSLLARISEWISGTALRVVRKLEQAIVRARHLMERVRLWVYSRPRSITELLNRLGIWIQSLPERALMMLKRIVWVVHRYLRRNDSETDTTESDPTNTSSTETTTTTGMAEPSFRELWRAFARQIDPSRWRTRTPGEIARDAIDQEYPDEPVFELTELFREVEYGGRSCSDTVRERAEDAYSTIESDPPADAEGEEQ